MKTQRFAFCFTQWERALNSALRTLVTRSNFENFTAAIISPQQKKCPKTEDEFLSTPFAVPDNMANKIEK